MSADDECDISDTETIVFSNDDGDCSESSFSQDTSQDTDIDPTVSLYDTASEDTLQTSFDVECAQEPLKSGEDCTLGSKNASEESMCECKLINNTEKALTSFERFIFPEWPKQTAEGNDEALEVLNLQLHHGGGFCANMKLIDLSTPANVRFDIQCVLNLLKEKMSHSTINSVERFVLPNVKELTGGAMVKNMLGGFCGVLCGENIKIKEVVLRSDEVSSGFTAGDLEWVKGFLSHYNLDKVTIYPARSKNKEYKKLCKQLCGKKKAVYSDRTFFLKRPTADNNSNTSKRACSETTVGEDNDVTDADNIINDEATEVPVLNNKLYSTILWDHWGTDKLHEKGINGRGVNIAFLDSGINIAHNAFRGRITAVNDITCSGNIDLTTDRSGHGTLCASIACGTAFKSTGSKGQSVQVPAGVAPGANIVVYKITGSTGQAHTAMITKGLQQCLLDKDRYKIDIVLLSYGSDYYDNEQVKAIHALHNHGVHVVTASGNNGKLKEISYPARVGHTICIGAHDKHGHTTSNTSEGRALDFTAPGENLTGASSVHPSMFTTEGGTSFAAACVAGLLALIIQRARDIASNPRYSGIHPSVNELVHDQNVIKEVLKNISRYPEYKVSCGYGCLQPTKMLFHDHRLLELLYKDV